MAKILLVEDDTNLREILQRQLESKGHQVLIAINGKEGLAAATSQKPDLVVADVIMPELSGFDVVEQLRANPETKDTKVVMVTALNQPEDRARGEHLGVSAYIAKSDGTPADYVATIEAVLTANPQAPPAQPPTQGVDTGPTPL